MFADAVGNQSGCPGISEFSSMYKVILALYLPPRPGATFNFIKKLVKSDSEPVFVSNMSVRTCFSSLRDSALAA